MPALWIFLVHPSLRTAVAFAATIAGVVILHGAWDGFHDPAAYGVLGLISVGWLLWRIRRIRLTDEVATATSQPAPAPAAPVPPTPTR